MIDNQTEQPRTKLYKTREAAALLRLSSGTVRAWIRCGKINAVKLGPRTMLVTSDEIDRLLRDGAK